MNSVIRGDKHDLIMQSIDHLENKLRQIKATIWDILLMLELQERVYLPDLVGLLASLSSDFSTVQEMMKKSCLPSQPEDNGLLLKSALFVPNFTSLDVDQELLNMTENRVPFWNHDVVPNYLRTKLEPNAIEEQENLEEEAQSVASNVVSEQIVLMNKNISAIVNALETSRNAFSVADRPSNMLHIRNSYVKTELETLVMAIMRGHGIRPKVVEPVRAKKPRRG